MANRMLLQRYFPLFRQVRISANQLNISQTVQRVKVSRLWQLCANQSARVRLGTFLTTTLGASRGFSLWSSKPKKDAEPEPAEASTEVVAAEEADRLYDANSVTSLYDYLIKFKDTDDDSLLWRLARASRSVAQLSATKPEVRKQLTYEALEFAQRALEANPKNFASHKWYAICLSEVGDYEGTKQKISNAYTIKEHFQQAILLNPQDATSVHLFGLWCFTFADMPWYQKKVAAVVFTTPPSSTYEEALEQFLKAESVSPNFYSKNLLMIGKVYQKLNNTKMALLYLTKARDFSPKTEEDIQVHNEAKALVASITK